MLASPTARYFKGICCVSITASTGATGATGATGPTGTNVTATSAFAANTAGSAIAVTVLGTAVPLPNPQLLSADISVDVTNTIFTVNTAGRYRLSYEVNTTLGLVMGTRLLISGSPNTASTIAPVVTLANYSNEILLDLAVGTTVTLQLFGIATTTTLLTGAGATLMLLRLS